MQSPVRRADLLACHRQQLEPINPLSPTSHRSIMTIRSSLPIVLLLATLTACGGGQTLPPPEPPDLVAVLKTRPSLKRFTEALETTGVASTLLPSGNYTVLAPMDKGVNGPLDETTVRHHVLTTKVTFSEMAGETTSYETLAGDEIEVDVTEQIAVGTGLMVESDITATNGVIHVIDRVQTPEATATPLIDQQPLEPEAAPETIENTVVPAAPTTTN
ncbi:MAG: fasciclin domain-containing protein [Geminicoccaceae bacterium]